MSHARAIEKQYTFFMRSRRKGQTIFELLWLIFIVIVLIAGIYYGSRWGFMGAMAGGIIGGVGGYFLGQLSVWACIWIIGSLITWSERRKGDNP